MDDRYSSMISTYLESLQSHHRVQSIADAEDRFLNKLKGDNVYRGYVRGKATDGADVRTMKSFLRQIGAIDDEDSSTIRGTELQRIGLKPFLQKYVPRVKVVSPQSKRKTVFREGHKQASYGVYRIRLFFLILFTARVASERRSRCTIEDVALTACRFWPLAETPKTITETLVKQRIENHFARKVSGALDYSSAFETELSAARKDSQCPGMSEQEISRKFRNTADNVNNYFRLLSALGLVDTCKYDLQRGEWSLSRFADGKTGPVSPCKISLSSEGNAVVDSLLQSPPVWFIDVITYIGTKRSGLVDATLQVLHELATSGVARLPATELVVDALVACGVPLDIEGDVMRTQSKLDFEWCYDMHSTGASVRALFNGAV